MVDFVISTLITEYPCPLSFTLAMDGTIRRTLMNCFTLVDIKTVEAVSMHTRVVEQTQINCNENQCAITTGGLLVPEDKNQKQTFLITKFRLKSNDH